MKVDGGEVVKVTRPKGGDRGRCGLPRRQSRASNIRGVRFHTVVGKQVTGIIWFLDANQRDAHTLLQSLRCAVASCQKSY